MPGRITTESWTVQCTTADCTFEVADSAKAVVVAARDAHTTGTGHRRFIYLHGGLKCAPF